MTTSGYVTTTAARPYPLWRGWQFYPQAGLVKRTYDPVFGGMIEEWFNEEAQWHRVGGPARTWEGFKKVWFWKGEPHRIGKPAIVYDNGGEEYWMNGQRHNANGPAVNVPTSYGVSFWLHGKRKTVDEFCRMIELETDYIPEYKTINSDLTREDLLMLKMQYG